MHFNSHFVFCLLGDIDSQWHRVQDLLKAQLQTNATIVTLWGHYTDSNNTVNNTVEKIQPLTEAPLVFHTQSEVKAMLDKTKVGEVCDQNVFGSRII